jgi:hypothetical protein
MEPPHLARLAQAAVSAALIGATFAWIRRSADGRRGAARRDGERFVLAYPKWLTWLGVGTAVGFAALASAAAVASSGGPLVAALFAALSCLGVWVVAGAQSEQFAVDAVGVERRRFGRALAICWRDLASVQARGMGLRLSAQDGTRFDCPQWLDGFGVLCDHLLQHAPERMQADVAAAAIVVPAATLPLPALQHAYARWFEREADIAAPPSGMTRDEVAASAGSAFAARLLSCRGSFLPFEAHAAADGALRITHDGPRNPSAGLAGFAALRFDGKAVVVATDAREERIALEAAND